MWFGPARRREKIKAPCAAQRAEINIDRQKINFTIIDTPGFGDLVNNSASVEVVANYVEEQFHTYLKEESRIQRNAKFLDPRVHCILYFIAPNGHGLTALDVSFMRRLGTRANLIPVIAKSDTMNQSELAFFKEKVQRLFISPPLIILIVVNAKIKQEIEENAISIFDFPYASDVDDEVMDENDYLEVSSGV